MNRNDSDRVAYHGRWLGSLLARAIRSHSVVVLTGARQVGKSTLLRHAEPFRTWRYHTLDTFDVRERVRSDPRSLWAGARKVVLDEVQKAPELLLAVKQAVDEDRSLRFALAGSAKLLLMRQVSESLAGRAVYFVLEPMTFGEMQDGAPPDLVARALAGQWPEEATLEPPPDAAPLVLRGSLPALLAFEEREEWLRWWEGYVATYLERDLREFSRVDSLVDFRRVMQLLALRSAQLLNQTEVGRDARLSQPTIYRYLNLLEATHLFQRLPAYTASRTTRLLKAPRAFWTDPGLAAFLSEIHDEASLRSGRHFGPLFETLVYQHLRALCSVLTPQARLHTWRTRQGEEVDFVIEHGQRVLAVEAKLATEANYRLAAGLRAFLAEVPDAAGGLLIYAGSRVVRLAEKIVAAPWTLLAGEGIKNAQG